MSNNKPRDHIGSIMPTNKNHHKKGANSQNCRIDSPKYFSISPKFKHIKRTPSYVSRPKEIRHLSISNINRKKPWIIPLISFRKRQNYQLLRNMPSGIKNAHSKNPSKSSSKPCKFITLNQDHNIH